MDLPVSRLEEFMPESQLMRDGVFLGLTLVVVAFFAAANNVATPDDRFTVGNTEVYTECAGIDAGICLGVERRNHETYNYDNYTDPKPGTQNFYRLVETELMLQATNICENDSISGMDWVEQASYRNRSADSWVEEDGVELLPCSETYRWRVTD